LTKCSRNAILFNRNFENLIQGGEMSNQELEYLNELLGTVNSEIMQEIVNNQVEIRKIKPAENKAYQGKKVGDVPQLLRYLWQYSELLYHKFEHNVDTQTIAELTSQTLDGKITKDELIDDEKFARLFRAYRAKWFDAFIEILVKSQLLNDLFWLLLRRNLKVSSSICLGSDFEIYEYLGDPKSSSSNTSNANPVVITNYNAKA